MDDVQAAARNEAWTKYDPPLDYLDRAIQGDPIAVAQAIQQAYKSGFDAGAEHARKREFEASQEPQ
jgi:hypothetical protein